MDDGAEVGHEEAAGLRRDASPARELLQAALAQSALKAARAHLLTRMARMLADTGTDSGPGWTQICRAAAHLTGDSWIVVRLDPSTRGVRLGAAAGPNPDVERKLHAALPPVDLPDSLGDEALTTGGPLVAYGDELVTAVTGRHPELAPLIASTAVTGMVIVPMASRGRVLGSLIVVRHDRDQRFSDDEVEFVVALADRGGVGIDNDQLQARAQVELTERLHAEALVASQTAILEAIARGASLSDTLAAVCRLVEAHVADAHCLVLPTGEGATTAPPEPDLPTSWSIPLVAASGNPLGTLAVSWPEPHQPDPAESRVGEAAASLAGMAIERARVEAAMSRAATHDPLTTLPNRAMFLDALRQALARCRRRDTQVAVLFLDLDRFKVINDSLGHAAGDRLLVAAAERLVSAVRPGDTVARFGGDEFTVVCEDVEDGRAAHRVAARLVAELSRPFSIAHRKFYVSASIGIALGGPGDRPEALLRDADTAMYRAKEQGRERIELFDEGLRTRTLDRLEVETAIRQAIDAGGLVVHYQPIVHLATGRINGAEALVRWQRPDGRLAMPSDFIGPAEETGLIVPLGHQVLDAACGQAAAWIDAEMVERGFSVAVNISPLQLADYDLADSVAAALVRHELEPHRLCLEITETSLVGDLTETQAVLAKLHALGIRLAIDDFGAGYSSLARLRELPVDALKVHQLFVAALDEDRRGAELMSGLTSLARAIDMVVIAEGVERRAQLDILRELRCEAAQGFYLAPPQPPTEMTAMLERQPTW